ncbi:MAG: O-antigen ligase family protein [Alphaproteobacteria bacterium]
MMILRYFSELQFIQIRVAAFVVAMVVYGGFGSPTPDVLGGAEIVVAGLLLFAVGVEGGRYALVPARGGALWRQVGQGVLVYGLLAGLVMGVMQGNDLRLIVRDVIPFLFLVVPLFFAPLLQSQSWWVVVAACGVGVLFAVRVVSGFEADALYYLGNSPLVLFTALLCAGVAIMRLAAGFKGRNILVAVAFLAVAGLCVLPLMMALQRASLAYMAVYAVIVLGLAFMRYPKRALVMVAVLGIPLLIYVSQMDVMAALRRKSSLYGANMRVEEWAAVWEAVSASPFILLFGQGWGASFSSPAVADIEVNFTHSLLSSMVLKTGVVGLVFVLAYLAALAREGVRVLRVNPFVALALLGPIVIDVLFYAAYKSLDFGIILSLVVFYAGLYKVPDQRFVAN